MFRFKQFAVRQDRCPMKVGTDGVLLGAWAEVRPGDRRMLDVGTGTGLIALMLAQRSAARITAVDVDAECATQAAEKFCRVALGRPFGCSSRRGAAIRSG